MTASPRQLAIRLGGPPAGYAAAHALRLTRAPLGAVLVYHSLAERSGDPRRELVAPVGVRLFRRQLRFLRACFRPVRSSELRAAAQARRRGERIPAAITFDDDLPSHRRLALPALAEAGFPALFFLTGAALERPAAFWWDRLQAAVDAGVAERALAGSAVSAGGSIHDVGIAIRSLDPADRDAVDERLASALDPGEAGNAMPAEDVRALIDAGHEIGFHTRRHDYLPLLDDAMLASAMHDGREELERVTGGPLDTIAYPHGGVDARVADAARAAGYGLGFTAEESAAHPSDADPLLIGRVDPSPASVGHLALRLARALLAGARSGSGAAAP